MEVLCFDIASGGVSGARFDQGLNVLAHFETSWNLATLTPLKMQTAFRDVAGKLLSSDTPAAISVTSFMHGFLVVDAGGNPVTPIYTWLDTADPAGMELVRKRVGIEFHQRTGCRYHPMFPVFKIAGMNVSSAHRVVSPKAWCVWSLTGEWAEDYGLASASGLLNVHSSDWDPDILRQVNLSRDSLPPLLDREAVVGRFDGAPVINGSGDGFMATLGSDCEKEGRVAVTLGTTASARLFLPAPVLSEPSGTFCYRANRNAWLLGCAGNNGGNVLDWARRNFGTLRDERRRENVPIFLPFLNGERSPEWNPGLRASWHDVTDSTTVEAMKQSIVEGVLFNLAQYVEILESLAPVRQLVLSGNGFLEPGVAGILASVVRANVLQPASFGDATMRGAAISAWRALGRDPSPAMEGILSKAAEVVPLEDQALLERFARFKELRGTLGKV